MIQIYFWLLSEQSELNKSKKYIEEVHDSQAALSIRSGDSMTLKKILKILVFKMLEV